MKLKNVDFKTYVFGQSGVQGFFGEGDEYRHHAFMKFIPGFSFLNMGFVAKTATVEARIYPQSSNTELRDGYKLKRLFPKSIWWSLRSIYQGYMLNAVGLANPGIEALLNYGKWQNRGGAFQLSFMPMQTGISERVDEAAMFADRLNAKMPFYLVPMAHSHVYGLQVNESCPNTGHDQKQNAVAAIAVLKKLREKLPNVPLIVKFDFTIEPETIVAIKPYCDAFMMGNTIAFGKKPEKISWKDLFKKGTSPLLKYFGGKFAGGLSGAPLFPVLVEWLERMQAHDPTVTIIAGGGIMKKSDIKRLSEFSIVHGVALGSFAIMRPWRVQGLINYGNEIFKKRNQKQVL